jgi:hypothetical protein
MVNGLIEGKIETGNQRFSHEDHGAFRSKFSRINQSIDMGIGQQLLFPYDWGNKHPAIPAMTYHPAIPAMTCSRIFP